MKLSKNYTTLVQQEEKEEKILTKSNTRCDKPWEKYETSVGRGHEETYSVLEKLFSTLFVSIFKRNDLNILNTVF